MDKPEIDTKETETRRRRNRAGFYLRLASGVAIVAVLVVVVAFGSRFGSDPNLVESPLIGQPAPDLALPLLEGDGELPPSRVSGKVVVVNFWASWCVACRAEHDDLVATAAAFEDKDVEFVGVVYQDDPEAAAAFLDELGWGSNYEYVVDPGSRTAISFGVFGVPETFFIDSDGIVVGKITGESNAALLGSTLDRILAGDRPGEQTVGTVQESPGG